MGDLQRGTRGKSAGEGDHTVKISVITVSWNSAATIEETIQSVLAQDHKDIEYIIIDGASRDNTMEIINKYPVHVVVSEPDKGIYDAMNKGLARASGDIVAILNSDDIYKNNTVLSRVAAEFEKYDCDALSTDIEIFRKDPGNIIRYYSCTKWKPWMFRIGAQPPHPGFFIRKNIYDEFGYFDTGFKIAADFELMLRFILKHKIKVHFSPWVSVSMRAGGESQRSLRNIARTNYEDHLALKKNGFFSTVPSIWTKYLIKIFQIRF